MRGPKIFKFGNVIGSHSVRCDHLEEPWNNRNNMILNLKSIWQESLVAAFDYGGAQDNNAMISRWRKMGLTKKMASGFEFEAERHRSASSEEQVCKRYLQLLDVEATCSILTLPQKQRFPPTETLFAAIGIIRSLV